MSLLIRFLFRSVFDEGLSFVIFFLHKISVGSLFVHKPLTVFSIEFVFDHSPFCEKIDTEGFSRVIENGSFSIFHPFDPILPPHSGFKALHWLPTVGNIEFFEKMSASSGVSWSPDLPPHNLGAQAFLGNGTNFISVHALWTAGGC